LLIIPLAMTALIGMIFNPGSGSETKLPAIKLLLVDKDKGLASKFLIGVFDQKEIKDMFQVTLIEEAAGEKLMKKGKASAMLVIPKNFSNDLAERKACTLEVVKNPSEEFLPGVAEEFARTMAVGFSAIAQVFADELKVIQGASKLELEAITVAQMTPFLEMARGKIIALKSYLSPLILQMKASTTEKPGKSTKPAGFNIFAYIMPGMLIMFLLFIIEAFMREIQNERADGKIRRMMFSSLTTRELVTARLFSGWLMGILVCILAMAVGTLIFRIDWGNPLLLLLLIMVSCFWCAAFFGMLNAFFKNKNQAGAFSSPIIMVFAAFGGSMLSLEQIPPSMRWISKFTVNNWFITGCQQIMDGKIPSGPFTVLAVSGLIFASIAMVALQRRLST
jgi:ABC-2 type transport system permease protein